MSMKKSEKMSELEKKLAAEPDVSRGRERKWTMEQDSVILRFWEAKGGPAVSKALDIPYMTVKRRYKALQDMLKTSKPKSRRAA
jgi:hypothetical protein